jgi:putative ATP-binding cassette transporter
MERESTSPRPAPAAPGRPHGWVPFLRQFGRLAAPYWRSERRWVVAWLTFALVGLTVTQVTIPIAINTWSQRLFDALEQRNLAEFVRQIGVLAVIIAANVLVMTTHLHMKRRLQVDWRAWLTSRLLSEWMSGGRHYQLTLMPGEHDNPDGRIAEDIRVSTEYAVDLAHSLFYCILLLVSFTQILWGLSGPPEVQLGRTSFYLPGHLVWAALLYAGAGATIATLLGQPLVRAANRRQREEANFRFGLVHARETALTIALRQGEGEERTSLWERFGNVVNAWNRQTRALGNLFMFSSSWSVLSQAFPILVAAPRYIGGEITLGVLMQTSQAFQQMIAALAWPIDNIPKLAEWRASVERVLGLHDALGELAEQVEPGRRPTITVEAVNEPVLRFRDVAVTGPKGEACMEGFSAVIERGERVLLSGDPGSAVILFRVVGGLWPWGRGRVELPRDASIFFMPRRPHIPSGSLRAVVTYPPKARRPDDAAIETALRRVGLGRLVPRLDEVAKWDEVLTIGEAQRLGFARLLLHRPQWIVMREATSGLDAPEAIGLLRLLQQEFPEATVVTIGREGPLEGFHTRMLPLPFADSACLSPDTESVSTTSPPTPA